MSGLLQRLGARAIGRAWAVRSDARLPFGAERLGEPQAADPAGVMAPGAPATGPGDTQQVQRAAAAPPSGPSPSTLSDLKGAMDTPQPEATRAAVREARPAHPLPPMPSAATQAERALPTPFLLPESAITRPMTGPPSDAGPQPAWPVPSRTAPQTLLPARPPVQSRRPLSGDAPLAASPGAFGAPPAEAGTARETEVHIHIGRIEVTALQEAPRPKAKPRERAQPMSLDTYLEQRRKVP